MVKKLKQMAQKKANQSTGVFDSELAQNVKESAQQIWLAGMGAFAKAQAEGSNAFEKLMKEGANLQRKTQAAAEEGISSVTGKMTAMAGEVGAKANAQWDKLETIFEQRTAKALGKLGVPTARDVAALNHRVDELTAALAKARKKPSAKKTVAATKAARPSAKRVARKAA